MVFVTNLLAQEWSSETQELRYVERDYPTTIDPVTVYDVASLRISEILFASLYSTNRFTERIPELAAGEPQLQDNKQSAIVKLKPGIKFSDGTPISVSDIIFTYRAATNQNSDNPNRGIFSNIKNITALDSSTIRVEFNYEVTDPKKYLMFFIIPKSAFLSPEINRKLTYCTEPAPVSGGYSLLVRAGTGHEFIFQKNSNYTGKAEPQIDRIKLVVYPDLKGHVDQLRNRQVDLVPYLPPEDIPQIERDSRFSLELYDSNQYDFIAFNFKNKLLKFTELRQAMNLAFNRQDILQSAFAGDGELMSGPFPPSHAGYNPEVEPYPYDLNAAKMILDNMGFIDTDGDNIREYEGQPLEFDLLTGVGEDATYNSIINAFIQQMKMLGIQIRLQSFLPDIFNDKVENGEFDLVFYNRKVTPQGDYSPFFISSEAYSGGKNFGYYNNSNVDSLFIYASVTRDFQTKIELYQDIHKILREDCPYIFLWYLRYNAAYDRRLKNVSLDQYYFFTTIEEWFFEE